MASNTTEYFGSVPVSFPGSASLADFGYQKLPSGLILQWGESASLAGGSHRDITYPIPFPTSVLQVQITPQATADSSTPVGFGWNRTSLADFTARNLSASSLTFNWLAIGY